MASYTIINPVLNLDDSTYVSLDVNCSNFFEQLNLFNVEVIDIPFEELISDDFDVEYDYIYLNSFSPLYFILREIGKLKSPFIIHMHIVKGQLLQITRCLPFLQEKDITIAPSFYAKKLFLKISEKFEISVVPYARDIESIYSRFNKEKTDGECSLSFMGRIVKEKGVLEYINVIAQLKEVINPLNAYIIGPKGGNKINEKVSDFYKNIQVTIEKYNLYDNITLTGILKGDEKYNTISTTDVFFNLSKYPSETFGVVNVEALATGVPVICTNVGAFHEIINDGSNGFIIDVSYKNNQIIIDEKQLFDKTKMLLSNTDLFKKIKQNAKDSILKYDYRNVIPDFIKKLSKNHIVFNKDISELGKEKIEMYKHLYNKEWYEIIRQYNISDESLLSTLKGTATKYMNNNINSLFIDLIKGTKTPNYLSNFPNEYIINLIYLKNNILEMSVNEEYIDNDMIRDINKVLLS